MSGKRISNEQSKESQGKIMKLDKEKLITETLKNNTNSDITNKEIENFLKIFNVVINQMENESKSNDKDSATEGGRKDILVPLGEEIYKFGQDIDSLNLPNIIKKALKMLKAIVTFLRAIKNHDQY